MDDKDVCAGCVRYLVPPNRGFIRLFHRVEVDVELGRQFGEISEKIGEKGYRNVTKMARSRTPFLSVVVRHLLC